MSETPNPIAAPPEGGTFETLQAPDGAQLRCASWRGGESGSVVLLGGLSEFIEKYFEVIHRLQARNFAVYTLDWRGQGLSTRALPDHHKSHVASFDVHLADLSLFMERIVLPEARRPLHLMCHSMGAHIGLRYLHDRPDDFERAACSAPLIDLPAPRGARKAGAFAVQLAAALGAKYTYVPGGGPYGESHMRFEGNPLTTDRARFERMHRYLAENPQLALGGPTIGWVSAALRSIALLNRRAFAARIETPTLVLCAADERIVSNDAMRRFVGRLPHGDLVTFEGARHEVLMEREDVQHKVWRAIDRHLGLA